MRPTVLFWLGALCVGCKGQCDFNEIVWPTGGSLAFPQTGSGGSECTLGGRVPILGSCVFMRIGYMCEAPRCGVSQVNRWTTTTPTCTQVGCNCAPQGPCRLTGVCSQGTCTNPPRPDGTTCSDNNPFTFNDVCLNGVCSGTTRTSCTGGCTPTSVCQDAACVQGTCANTPKLDGTVCGTNMVCSSGVCASTQACPSPCPAASPCHTGVCNNGACANDLKPDGTSCGTNMVCTNGVCQASTGCPTAGCPAASACQVGFCNNGVCDNTPKPDGTSCGTNMACSSGVCQAASSCSTACPAASVCHVGVCTNGVCGNTAKPDGTSCGVNAMCAGGVCSSSQGTVMDIVRSRNDLTQLEALLQANGIPDLAGVGPVTLFAPTDSAFNNINVRAADLLRVLRYHVVGRHVPYSEMSTRASGALSTLDSDVIIYTLSTITNEVLLDGVSNVVQRDLPASNGVVHVIDTVMLPNGVLPVVTGPPSSVFTPVPTGGIGTSVLDRISNEASLASFRNQLRATGVDGSLQYGVFTVFAPSNTAMASLGAQVNIDMPATMRNHIHSGAAVHSALLPAAQLTMLSGQVARVTNINGVYYLNAVARLSVVDLVASNGVVHIVEAVIPITTSTGGGVIVPTPPPVVGTNTVYDLLVRTGGYGSFVSALIHTGMDKVIRQGGDWTVFAPTDAAFIRQRINVQAMVNSPDLIRLVRYHIAPGRQGNIAGVGVIDTVDTPSRISYNTGVLDARARPTTAAMTATNGLVYGIDAVLAPPGVTSFTTPPPLTPTPGFVPNPNPNPVTWYPGQPPIPTSPYYTGLPWPVPPPIPTAPRTPAGSPDIAPGYPDMMDLLLGRAELSQFRLMVTNEGLVGTVNSVATVLAATNDAMLAGGVRNLPQDQALALIRNHIIQNQVLSTTGLVAGSPFLSHQRDQLFFTTSGFEILVNGVAVIRVRNLQAKNGMLHIIDSVLFPSWAPAPPTGPGGVVCSGQTVCHVLSREPSTHDFYVLLQSHGILATLNGLGPFTVLAPSNTVLMQRSAYLHTLTPEELSLVLRNHIVVGSRVPYADMLTNPVLPTLHGGNLLVDSSKITMERDIPATNGVVHVVSGLFIPDGVSGAPPLPTIPPQCGRTTVCGVISSHHRLAIFARYMQAVQMLDTMGTYGPYTVFAPTDTAFKAMPSGVRELLPRRHVVLEAVLKHHVVYTPIRSVAIPAVELPENSPLIPLQGEYLTAVLNQGTTVIGETATITIPDMRGSNGVVHVVSNVVLPKSAMLPSDDVVGVLQGVGKFSAFASLLSQANVMEVLGYAGPYTVFAPTNDAILSAGGVEVLMANTALLRRTLRYHISPLYLNSTEVFGGATVDTLDAQLTLLMGGIPASLNQPWVDSTLVDQYATNGIVHAVNTMLVPPQGVPPPGSITPSPGSSTCNVTAHCTGNAFSAVPVEGGCQCDCFVGWAGTSCERCASRYVGWPNCVLESTDGVATPVPTAAAPGPTPVPTQGGTSALTPPPLPPPVTDTPAVNGATSDTSSSSGGGGSTPAWLVPVLIVIGALSCGVVALVFVMTRKKPSEAATKASLPDEALGAPILYEVEGHAVLEPVEVVSPPPRAVSPYTLSPTSPRRGRGRGRRPLHV